MRKRNFELRVLENDADLLRFSRITAPHVGVHYPLDYLKRCKVTVITVRGDQNAEQILGGYVLALEGPFRVIEQLPPHVLQEKSHLIPRLDRAMELTGLWINPLMACGKTRFRLWWRIFMDVMKQSGLRRRHYFVYSYDSNKEKLRQMYSLANPEVIYKGRVFIEGMTEACEEVVEIGSIQAVLSAFVVRPFTVTQFISKRLLRKKRQPTSRRYPEATTIPAPVSVKS